MATKPKLDLHERVLKAFGIIKRTPKEEKARDVVNYFRDRKKDEIANHIKPMLEELQAGFERGEVHGGCTSLKQYCKGYKHYGVLSYARCRQILTGKSGNEGKKTKLRVDQVVMIGKQEVRLTNDMLEAVLSYVEPGHPMVKSLDPAPVTHAKYSARKTLCMANMPNRKLKGKVFAENWDAATCPDCVQYNERKKAQLAPKTVKGKEKKTHATGRERDAKLGRTRCQKEISEVTIDDKNPTCRLCQTSIEQDEHLKNGEEFDALIKSVKTTEKERRAAWLDFVNAKHGFIRGKNEFEWLPDKEQAALVLKNPLHFVKPQATVTVMLKKQVEGEHGTKLRTEAANAAWGDKKVSKKVYQRIYSGLEQYLKYWWTQQPSMPERPENATVKTQHDLTGNGCHMIAKTSPEYDVWQAANSAAHLTPEYTAWNKERTLIVDLQSALVNRYDPLTDADLDGDDNDNTSADEARQ